MRAIVTVVGKDCIGIIGGVCAHLATYNVNILDITQTVLQGYFTMTLVVDVSDLSIGFDEMKRQMEIYGKERSLDIRVQREEIFNAMYKL